MPVLQDIACTLSSSLLNKEIFGDYMDINYLFSIIRFSNNPQLQYAFAKILEEEAGDFNLELGIDTSCLAVPELFGQLSQPVIKQQPFCYKDVKTGPLQQVCSGDCIASIAQKLCRGAHPIYKTDSKAIKCDYDTAFPFLSKGEVINNVRSGRKFYLQSYDITIFALFCMGVYRFETMDFLENETISLHDIIHQNVNTVNVSFNGLFKQKDVEIPVVVSVRYISYTSSLKFSVKIVGAGTKTRNLTGATETGEPLTLTRF